MPYSILLVSSAAKKCEKIKDKKLKERIASALEFLADDPFQGKPLKAEFKGCYSYRIGDFRIIYCFSKEKKVLNVLKLEHRREVYR